eukprot:5806330-Alexandrium_andersonii.AAC.1
MIQLQATGCETVFKPNAARVKFPERQRGGGSRSGQGIPALLEATQDYGQGTSVAGDSGTSGCTKSTTEP